jgi:hypothetical protein
MNNSVTTTPPPAGELSALPPIVAIPVTTASQRVIAIVTAYNNAVDGLSQLQGAEHIKQRNRLFLGSRRGSRVGGVHDKATVEEMLRHCVMNGMACSPKKDAHGNNVYCFSLSNHYLGKGRSTYVRLSDLRDRDLKDNSELHVSNIGIGVDYDDVSHTEHLRLQAPKVHNLHSSVVTVVLNPDNSQFVEWYCGEPEKFYGSSNLHEILDSNGRVIIENLWVELNLDYDRRSSERRINRERRNTNKKQEQRPTQHEHKHEKREYKPAPLTSVGAVLAEAQVVPAPEAVPSPTEHSVASNHP